GRSIALRHGRNRRPRRGRGSQPRCRPDSLHPHHDAGHPPQRDDGHHAGRADHERDHARTVVDLKPAGALLGPDHELLDRQCRAGAAQHPDDRHLDPPADDPLSRALSDHPRLRLHGHLQHQLVDLRHLDRARGGSRRLPLPHGRPARCAAHPGLRSRPHARGIFPARDGRVARQLHPVRGQAGQPGAADPDARDHPVGRLFGLRRTQEGRARIRADAACVAHRLSPPLAAHSAAEGYFARVLRATMRDERLQKLIDREELYDLVRRERFARDRKGFDVMRACFHADAYVQTSWYEGTGAEAYVEASRKRMGDRPAGTHWVFPAFAQVEGDRATVESPALIASRTRLEGIEVDFQVFCRFFTRAVREAGEWKLLTFRVLFERDNLNTVDPADPLPVDRKLLATLRPSYKHLAYVQQSRGVKVNPDLLGDDRPDALAAFHADEERWLRQGT